MGIRTGTFLIAIIAIGVLARLIGINFGLPFVYHNDESVLVNYALAYGAGDLNPHNFLLPPLPSYLLFFCYGLFFLLGELTGYFAGVDAFARSYVTDPTAFFLIGRIALGVLPGAATIYYLYLLGKKCFSVTAGLIAAFLLSVNFLHVLNSHYIYGDILLTLVAVMYFLLLHDIYEKNSLVSFLKAGILLGVGISLKYNAFILIFPTAIVGVYNLWRYREYRAPGQLVLKMLVYAGAVLAALFVTNPYMFLDFETFRYFLGRMPLFSTGLLYHLKVSILGSVGLPALVFTVLGVFFALKRRNILTFSLVFFMVVYYVILIFSSQTASRYVLMIMPLIVLFSAYGISEVAGRFSGDRRAKALVLLIIISAAYTMVKTVYSDILFFKEDTRTTAFNWAVSNLPQGEKIAIDAAGPAYPQLKKTRGQLEEELKSYSNEKFKKPKGALDLKIKVILDDPDYDKNTYSLYYLFPSPGKKSFLGTISQLPVDVGAIKAAGIKYVFINRILALDKYKGFMEELSRNAELVKEFSPYKKNRARFVPKEYSKEPAAAFSMEELMDRERYGPVLRVYKIKE